MSLVEEPRLLQAIGLMTVRWSSLDSVLAKIVGRIRGSEEHGRAWLGHRNSGIRRYESMEKIVAKVGLEMPVREQLLDSLARIKGMLDERNRFTHDPVKFSIHPDDIASHGFVQPFCFMTINAKDPNRPFLPISPDLIDSHSNKMKAITNELIALFDPLVIEPRSSSHPDG